MKTITQSIVLKNDRHWGIRPPAEAVGEVLRLVTSAVRSSIRMRFEGRSSFRGARPGWLDAASDVRFLGQDGKEDTTLFFEMPELGEAAPKLYEQQELWPTRPDAKDTGFDLLGDVINDVTRQDMDSERFDNPLLRRIGRFDLALNGTFQALDVVSRRYSSTAPAEINRSLADIAKKMTGNTPQPQAVRVSGKLDMIRASTQSFALQLVCGDEVRGVVDGFDVGTLTKYFQQSVLVLGRAIYRPSGRLLRIDATEMKPATDDERFFSKVPSPRQVRIDAKALLRPTALKNGVSAIFGKWPGDETDEQVEAALKEIG
jgi:hypothetical protein